MCLERIMKYNDSYVKHYDMHIIFRLMCHNPKAISKWIYCKKSGTNVKTLRSFISYMSLEPLFEQEDTLLNGKDIFEIISFQYSHNIFFSEILKWRERLTVSQLHHATSSNKNLQDDD